MEAAVAVPPIPVLTTVPQENAPADTTAATDQEAAPAAADAGSLFARKRSFAATDADGTATVKRLDDANTALDAWLQSQPPATLLAQRNPYEPFDKHITFDEPNHLYFVDGVVQNGSVTGFIHHYFPGFDQDKTIQNIVNGRRWSSDPTYLYYQKSPDAIAAMWALKGGDASERGTRMHALIEYYFNGMQVPQTLVEKYAPEFKLFLGFVHREVLGKLEPFRTEMRVYDREHGLCGSIDMLFRRIARAKDGSEDHILQVFDWKRCREFKIKGFRTDDVGLPPLSHLPNCNGFHYSLQLNVYKRILEQNTPFRIERMMLARFHPDGQQYELLDAPLLTNEVAQMFMYRKMDLEKVRAAAAAAAAAAAVAAPPVASVSSLSSSTVSTYTPVAPTAAVDGSGAAAATVVVTATTTGLVV